MAVLGSTPVTTQLLTSTYIKSDLVNARRKHCQYSEQQKRRMHQSLLPPSLFSTAADSSSLFHW
jgi:hypothetical protein